MKPDIEDIVKKMDNEEYPELNWDFAYKLTNESDRGAILIGASKVEEYLEKLVLLILPKTTKSYTNYLLKYPGPISSFSGKIELLFGFRIIDESLYTSLNHLRSIRNKAAHTSESFQLSNFKSELEKVNEFEEDGKELVELLAWNSLIEFKKSSIIEILDKRNLDQKTYNEILEEKTAELSINPHVLKQSITWNLSYGLTLMCLKIMVIHDEYEKLDRSKIWIEHI